MQNQLKSHEIHAESTKKTMKSMQNPKKKQWTPYRIHKTNNEIHSESITKQGNPCRIQQQTMKSIGIHKKKQ